MEGKRNECANPPTPSFFPPPYFSLLNLFPLLLSSLPFLLFPPPSPSPSPLLPLPSSYLSPIPPSPLLLSSPPPSPLSLSPPSLNLPSSSLSQVVINCSVLPALQHLLSHPPDNLQKEACWAVSNITAGNRVQIQVCVNNITT